MSRTMKLESIIKRIKNTEFPLHGSFRFKLEDGKQVSHAAFNIVTYIETILAAAHEDARAVTYDECKQVADKIRTELTNKLVATSGSFFFGLGARDEVTVKLYSKLISIINNDIEFQPPQLIPTEDKIENESAPTMYRDVCFIEMDKRRQALEATIYQQLCKQDELLREHAHLPEWRSKKWQGMVRCGMLPRPGTELYTLFFTTKIPSHHPAYKHLQDYHSILRNENYLLYRERIAEAEAEGLNHRVPAASEVPFSDEYVAKNLERKQLEQEIFDFLLKHYNATYYHSRWNRRTAPDRLKELWEDSAFLDEYIKEFSQPEIHDKLKRYKTIINDKDYQKYYLIERAKDIQDMQARDKLVQGQADRMDGKQAKTNQFLGGIMRTLR